MATGHGLCHRLTHKAHGGAGIIDQSMAEYGHTTCSDATVVFSRSWMMSTSSAAHRFDSFASSTLAASTTNTYGL